ncbi:hypothetical protein CDD83_4334 [Cordyceps sp. RAO-2017]|nr:hypothetical protein CDD83_4334 [Cordyceps sp. RAO-2017]
MPGVSLYGRSKQEYMHGRIAADTLGAGDGLTSADPQFANPKYEQAASGQSQGMGLQPLPAGLRRRTTATPCARPRRWLSRRGLVAGAAAIRQYDECELTGAKPRQRPGAGWKGGLFREASEREEMGGCAPLKA